MKEIFSAMLKAQKEYAPVLKKCVNPHFKSRYADLKSSVEAVTDALNANGITLAQVCHPDPQGVIVETVFLHESGESWSGGKLFVPSAKMDAQGFCSANTYARRYSLMAACGIAPEDDDGNGASIPPGQPTSAPPKAPASKPATAQPKPATRGFDAYMKAICEAQDRGTLQRVGAEIKADSGLDDESRGLLRAKYEEIWNILPAVQ